MPDASSWNVISEAGSNRVILGIDFPAAGRTEASITDLAGKLGSGYGFVQVVPPRVSPSQRVPAEIYIRQWIEELQRNGWNIAAVLGYCIGGVYAAAVAERISGWQATVPKVVLFDPMPADIRLLGQEVGKIIDRLAPLLSDDETRLAMKQVGELTCGSAGDTADLAQTAIALAGLYRETGSAAFGRLGLNEARRNEMTQLFESYLAWLSVAAQINPLPIWKKSTAIFSTDHIRQASETKSIDVADIFGRIIAIEAAHGDLLRDDSAVRAVLGQMEEP